MNIGIFSDTYTPQVNGVVTVIRALKKGLEDRGHKVYIFTVQHPKAEAEDGVYRLLSLQFPNEPQHRIGMFFKKPIYDIARKLNLDLINTHSEFSLYLASRYVSKKFGIPSIHTLHTYYPDYVYYLPPPIKQIMQKKLPAYLRRILRSQKCVITPSVKNAEYLSGISFSKPVKIIPNGIDLSHFFDRSEELKNDAKKMRVRLGVKDSEDMIVFVGRLGAEKNVHTLIENFREITVHRDAKLVIVGDGPDRRALENLCLEKNIRDKVIFSGYFQWPEEIKQVYAASDLFMSASHSEVHPITFIEAMAMGLPIVAASDKSIENMVINNENGWTVNDDSKLWEKALEILDEPSVLERMGKKSEEIAHNFTLDKFIDNMIACYNELL